MSLKNLESMVELPRNFILLGVAPSNQSSRKIPPCVLTDEPSEIMKLVEIIEHFVQLTLVLVANPSKEPNLHMHR